MSSTLQNWSLHHLKLLIDYLDDESLLQIIQTAQYMRTPEDVAGHFSGLLGDDQKAISFISEFNSRRFPPSSKASVPSKRAENLVQPGSRQDKSERKADLKATAKKPIGNTMMSSDLGLKQKPVIQAHQKPHNQKVKKVDALTEIDAALRDLELSTSATSTTTKQITCDCAARRHGLNQVSPNCLSCGKIICSAESYSRCSFCHAELLTRSQRDEIITELKRERGAESTSINNQSQKKRATAGSGAKVAYSGKAGASYSTMQSNPPTTVESLTSQLSLSQIEQSTLNATKRKEELLDHVASNYRRTVIDQASDFTSDSTDKWATPAQRALSLRKAQAKLLASQESGRVISLTLSGGKVKVSNNKREQSESDYDKGIEREQKKLEDEKKREEVAQELVNQSYSPNKLMRDLKSGSVKREMTRHEGEHSKEEEDLVRSEWWKKGRKKGWRRVQDFEVSDEEEDEQVISRNEAMVVESMAMDGQPGREEELGTSKR